MHFAVLDAVKSLVGTLAAESAKVRQIRSQLYVIEVLKVCKLIKTACF